MPSDPRSGAAERRDTRGRLDEWLSARRLLGASVERLVQDAGERVYFRVRPPDAAQEFPGGAFDPAPRGFVACVMAAPYAPGSLPFANAAGLYREMGVPGPQVLEEAPERGVVALQDLGDDLLQIVVERDREAAAGLYEQAVRWIGRIQREGARVGASSEASRYRAFSMRLDEALFVRELRFFVEHFVCGHLGFDGHPGLNGTTAPGKAFLGELDALLSALAAEAAATPTALCHRDYHSRNLIAVAGRGAGAAAGAAPGSGSPSGEPAALHVIDHQDTRLGPRAYDLMSLARDPYVGPAAETDPGVSAGVPPELPVSEADLRGLFREAAGLGGGSGADLEAEFDAVALQRHLKALGTYGFARRRNPVYRRFVAPTLAMVAANLARHADRPARRALRARLTDLGLFA